MIISDDKWLEDCGRTIVVEIDVNDDDRPIKIDEINEQWLSVADAKSLVRFINRAIKIYQTRSF